MNLGLLCHKKNGNALCHKKGGNALIYKCDPPGDITIIVSWSPKQYTCTGSHVTHDVKGTLSYSVVPSGAASLVSSDIQPNSTSDQKLVYAVVSRPFEIHLTLNLETNCVHQEYMSETMRLMVSQKGVTPKMKSVVAEPAPKPQATATINIDANGKLSSIT